MCLRPPSTKQNSAIQYKKTKKNKAPTAAEPSPENTRRSVRQKKTTKFTQILSKRDEWRGAEGELRNGFFGVILTPRGQRITISLSGPLLPRQKFLPLRGPVPDPPTPQGKNENRPPYLQKVTKELVMRRKKKFIIHHNFYKSLIQKLV